MSLAEKQALQKQAVIDYMKVLPVKKYAAANAGIGVSTLDLWLKEDKDFCNRFEESRSQFFKAKGAKAKPEFLLERLDPETFGNKDETVQPINVIAAIINKYGTLEGVDEIPRIEEAESGPPQESA
jgi:hypothetical protein